MQNTANNLEGLVSEVLAS